MKKLVGVLVAGALVAIFAASLMFVERAKAQGQSGWAGEGGVAFGAQSPRVIVTDGTNSPGLAPPGTIWLSESNFYTGTNWYFNISGTNNAGTNFYTVFATGLVSTARTPVSVTMRIQVGSLSPATSVWANVVVGTNLPNVSVSTITP